MVAECLDACKFESRRVGGPLRILDPSCGDGAFLVELLLQMSAKMPGERIRIVRECLFGVDIDEAAIVALRERLRRMLSAECDANELEQILRHNFRVGDALSGRDWGREEKESGYPETGRAKTREPPGQARWGGGVSDTLGLHWSEAFPEVAAAGGFDVAIGNPPYLRERDARELFERLAQTPLGQRWRQARMDLWYYFVHRAIDLLRPGGMLLFVVSRYWTSSQGAGKLIERLRRETTFRQLRLLEDRSVFKNVAGRHMTFQLLNRPATEQDVAVIDDEENGTRQQVQHAELFHAGRLLLTPALQHSANASSTSRQQPARTLGDLFETRQGIAENPPYVTSQAAQRYPDEYKPGEGVFVLTPEEVQRLELDEVERTLLKPYFKTASLGRYAVPQDPTHSLLYLTRDTAPDLEFFPQIALHLARFRPLLETRREVRQGKIAWWHLHWPREPRVFTEPRILSVQMGKRPQFVFVKAPTFVGFSVNVILATERGGISLEALTGLLNSNWAARWFQRHAKHRGANIDISGGVLREFPLPRENAELEDQVGQFVLMTQAGSEVDNQIDALVEEWYRAS